MRRINLRDYYQSLYSDDRYIDVSDDIFNLLNQFERERLRMKKADSRHLCDKPFIEGISESSIPRNKEVSIQSHSDLIEQLNNAMKTLTNTQQRRFIAYFFHGLNYRQIAQKENVVISKVWKSIEQARKKFY